MIPLTITGVTIGSQHVSRSTTAGVGAWSVYADMNTPSRAFITLIDVCRKQLSD